MEHNEVNNLLNVGHFSSLSETSLDLRLQRVRTPGPFAPFQSYPGNRFTPARRQSTFSVYRSNPILGVSKLVRRLKSRKSVTYYYPPPPVQPPPMLPPSPPSPSRYLQQVRDQMDNFVVPHDWQKLGDGRSSICGLHSIVSISGAKLVAELQEQIQRYRYLIDLQEQKIQSCKNDIIQYMDKLQKLDEQTEALDSVIAQVRTLGISRMDKYYQDCKRRIPLLANSHRQHNKIAGSIESFKRGSNVDTRLNKLRILISQAQKREIIRSRIKHYSLPFTAIVICILAILYQFLLCN